MPAPDHDSHSDIVGSGSLESDWIFSSDLAQHQLTKYPENNRPQGESFILGEEGRANGTAQSGEVCHLSHLPSLPDSPGCKSQRTVCPLGDHPGAEVHLNRAASCFPAPFLVLPFLIPLQFALLFLLLFPQQLWPAWRKSVVAFLWTLCLKTKVGEKEFPTRLWELPTSLLRRKR